MVNQLIVSDCFHAMGKIQKEGKWVSRELSELPIQYRLIICTSLLSRHKKQFLYKIITGDEKWIYYDNPKRKKSWVGPD